MQNSNFCVEEHLKLLVQGWKKIIYGSNPMIVNDRIINSGLLSVLDCGHPVVVSSDRTSQFALLLRGGRKN